MKITIEINTENAAFHTCDLCKVEFDSLEVCRILQGTKAKIESHVYSREPWSEKLMDANGNTCGEVRGEMEL